MTPKVTGKMLESVTTGSEVETIVKPHSRWAVTTYDWQIFGLYLTISGVLVLIAVQPGAETDHVFMGIIGILLFVLIVGVAIARLRHRPMWRGFSFGGVRPVREWLAGLPVIVAWISVYFFASLSLGLQGTAAGAATGFIWFMAAILLGDLVGRVIVPRVRTASSEVTTGSASV